MSRSGTGDRQKDPPPSVAVIIVNHATAEHCLAAVESIRRQPNRGCHVDIHVVDTASPGDDAVRLTREAAARGWGAAVRIWRETVNRGYGAGNNVVLEALAAAPRPPDYVLFLNPDARLANDAIAILARWLDAHPDAGFAGPQIRLLDRATLRTSAFRFPTLVSVFARAADLAALSRWLRHWQVALETDGRPRRVDWVSGAGFLARFRAVEALGFFDPAFFLYFEEVDLMRRGRARGWTCWHVPRAEILHEEGAATAGRGEGPEARLDHWYASWARYFRKSHGRAYALAAALLWLGGTALNVVAARFAGRPPSAPPGAFAAFRRAALRPLLGRAARRP